MSQSQTQPTHAGAASVTVVGPLTTPFTPSPECLSGLTIASRYLDPKDTETFYITMGFNMLASGAVATRCLPSAYLSALKAEQTIQPIMSPGSMCPIGYGPSCTIVGKGASIVAATDVIVWSALPSTQTAIGCCPSHYTCAQDSLYKCISTPGISETEIYATEIETLFTTITGSKTIDNTITLFPTASSYTKTWGGNVHMQADIKVIASALQVIYIQDEKPPSPNNQTTNEASSATPTIDAKPTSHLPLSIIVAIVVPIVVLSLISIGILIYCRRKRRKVMVSKPEEDFGKPELDSVNASIQSHEKDIKELHGENMYSNSHGIRELDGEMKAQDLYTNELDGDQRYELHDGREYIAELDATENVSQTQRIPWADSSRVGEGGWI
ncbi:hypothetical protein VHEMI02332 [[Torrubiella] hemipterigena]|uniref:Uncharacterized protein n=1 Tax=[Torrubiella] hemipterigena TaxID=1531966 RepID=A0A0A1SVI3_9HYPO|nr:hypothetical protein VHEMI02332 [[Torrubiella] hemipterigena]